MLKFTKLPIVSERDKNFLAIVLLIYGIRYLTILLRLDLLQALNGSLTNLTFLTFCCITNFVSSIKGDFLVPTPIGLSFPIHVVLLFMF